ncbi:MAG: methyl-accepting chemotaxis protein [Selenomonadaceae bacterium]|nr:methyl-accepting chemotaxis protein [Selenomonadaceae bacterium]
MGLRQKFYVLAGLSALLVAIMAIIGYNSSSSIIRKNVEAELAMMVESEKNLLNGWLKEKGASATHQANLLSSMNGDINQLRRRENLSLTLNDPELIEMTVGMEDGFFMGYHYGDATGKIDPRQRPWYQMAKSAGTTVFSDPYVDSFTNKTIVSAVAPFTANGSFFGAVCSDITLDELKNQVQNLKYYGEGIGFIVDNNGNILATNGQAAVMSNIRDIDGLGDQFSTIQSKESGFLTLIRNGEEQVFSFSKIPAANWYVCLSVPDDIVHAEIYQTRWIYLALFVGSFILMMILCGKIAVSVVAPISELKDQAAQLAEGNLQLQDLRIDTDDEIGQMTDAFNRMKNNLHKVITQMVTTSEQVAAASEQLTASAQQSADASVHVAETVAEVETNMEKQLGDIDQTKQNVDVVFKDIEQMSDRSISVSEASIKTSDAAHRGSELMQAAIDSMKNIETSVISAAGVVKKLGENSKQIGEIVEAITGISEQTNLLALNAAIEAARAGEHGRGFAVVAEEVRKLATASRESAEQIRDRIGSIQNDTEEAVRSMESGTADVRAGTDAISEVGAQFNSIMDMVQGIRKEMEGIMASVDTVSDGTTHIVEAVDSMDTVSRKTADDTKTISNATESQSASNQEIAAASQSLAKLATDMRVTIGTFKI